MTSTFLHRSAGVALCALAVFLGSSTAACGRKEAAAPPVATPSVKLSHERVPLGSPVEITYQFTVAKDAKFDENYRVFVHVVDADEELMWTDDHDPPIPTTQWKPGQTVQYTRTVWVPVYPYVGEAAIQLGLHSIKTQKRLPLAGQDIGQHSYKVARMQIAPQTDSIFTVNKDGWHAAEVADNSASVQWTWTKKDATLAFKNPNADAIFYLDVDNPGGDFTGQQHVTVKLNGETVDQFELIPKQEQLRKIALPATKLGNNEMAEVRISVDKTFVPMQLSPASKDPRELGVRVLHAFVARAQ
jgi:hypothetical protein